MENIIVSSILAAALLLPTARKWELEFRIVALWTLFAGVATGIFVGILWGRFRLSIPAVIAADLAVIVLLSAAALLIRFYRDDPRRPAGGRDVVVSPADGRIKYIKEFSATQPPLSEKGGERVRLHAPLMRAAAKGGYLIGIGMSFLDVHVTRAPIGGRLTYMEHIEGGFASLKRPDAPERNERLIEIFESREQAVGVVQIASRLVRRIVSYIDKGALVKPGQKIGMIRFGSQVDLVLPAAEGLRLLVRPGQRVYAGRTVIAIMKRSESRVSLSELKESDQVSCSMQGARLSE